MNVALDYNDSFYEVVISGKKSFEMAQKITEMYSTIIITIMLTINHNHNQTKKKKKY